MLSQPGLLSIEGAGILSVQCGQGANLQPFERKQYGD